MREITPVGWDGAYASPAIPALAIGLILAAVFVGCCIAGNPASGDLMPLPDRTDGNTPDIAVFHGNPGQSDLSELIQDYLDVRYPRYKGTGYPVKINVEENPWLTMNVPNASFVRAFIGITQPAGYQAFIAWNDSLFVMPEAFNAFMGAIVPTIATEDDALEVACLYVKAWEPRGVPGEPATVILSSAGDIPQRVSPVSPVVSGEVAPPRVKRMESNYSVIMATWSPFDGTVRAWAILVQPDGLVNANQRAVASGVGDFRGGHA